MAIPVQFQQFKAAGIYRVVYDKSTVLGTEAELLRLVVGYSPKGPFNTPVYIKSVSDFIAMFGNISKTLEKRGKQNAENKRTDCKRGACAIKDSDGKWFIDVNIPIFTENRSYISDLVNLD